MKSFLTFREEDLTPDNRPPEDLMRKHYDELHTYGLELMPDWEGYEADARDNRLAYVTAWRDEIMVGYAACILNPHRHYAGSQLAQLDVVYLLPQYRGEGWGKRLLEAVETAAIAKGGALLSFRCKADPKHDLVGLYESLGYKLEDYVFVKDLRHET